MKKLILAFIFMFLFSTHTFAITRTVAWYKHSSPEVVGYKLYYGTQSGVYTNVIDIPDRSITRYKLDLPAGTYYIAITAYTIVNGNEIESEKTYELKVKFALATPEGLRELA